MIMMMTSMMLTVMVMVMVMVMVYRCDTGLIKIHDKSFERELFHKFKSNKGLLSMLIFTAMTACIKAFVTPLSTSS